MPTYSFKATALMRGLVVYVEADDEADAKRKAHLGLFDDEDRDGSDLEAIKADLGTCREEM